MKMINRYARRSRISGAKFREIIKLFCADLTISQIAQLNGISRNTINKILRAVRIIIAEHCEQESPFDKGEIELDDPPAGGRGSKSTRVIKGAELVAKQSYLECSKDMKKCIHKS